MIYRLLADAVVLLHFGFVLFVIAGGLLLFRWPRALWLHLPALGWGLWVEAVHWTCPLTYLEASLWTAAGEATYRGDFVAHYVVPVLYPAGLTPAIQSGLGAAVLLVNACIYGLWWFRRPARGTPSH